MNHIPTPETDSWIGHGIGGLEVVPAFCSRSLERRLTIAREALVRITNEPLSQAYIEKLAEETLKLTKPKL